ncbi:unnamed protein product [Phytophthora fragariaefolia]|uniref:Unnamed protein product n=1 Tax=Phytophthora fragariaefolia TaxID=1490495 RepID=A0A9W6U5N9_9STRA|nr:unnamed protein product [Phytophthora fragariaefolia]
MDVGDDPPALVEPLTVTLKPDAIPFRAKPRNQELMSFISEDTVYSPTRVPQGAMDSSVHFQNQMQKIFADVLYTSLLLWIDDILVHAKSARTLLDALRIFFDRVRKHGLRLSAVKSCLFKKTAKWCGRMISGEGISHDPARLHALATLPLPSTGADLQQFLCAAGWLRDTLLDYARVARPLHDKLESVLATVGRTRRMAAGVVLNWADDERAAFEALKSLITSSQPLAFPSADSDVCVFTDASESGWGLIVTQVTEWDDACDPWDQAHQLLVCKSGIFSVPLKTGPSLIRGLPDYVGLCPLGRHIRGRLQRWALALAGFPYLIEHIEGGKNDWLDLLSRWGRSSQGDGGEVGVVTRCKAITRSSTRLEPISASANDNQLRPRNDGLIFPTLDEIRSAQLEHRRAKPAGTSSDDDQLIVMEGKVWLPEKAKNLVRRVMIMAHCGNQSHRGLEPMVHTIQQVFYVRELPKLCRQFLSRCLLCKHTKGGNIIPRPWGPTYQALKRNQLLHYDFLSMAPSMGLTAYVLVLKDGLTHFCELVACDSPTSAVAVQALLDWSKRFGAPEALMSDNGTHFKNVVVNDLCDRLSTEQEFVVPYSPWINGSVERINRDILQVLRIMLMEYQLDTREWVLCTQCTAVAAKDKRRRRNKAKSNGAACNFTEGDFVLWSRIGSRLSNNKLLVRWVGPFEVVEALPHSFMVRHLITSNLYNVHGSRLKFFADSSLDVTEELVAHIGNQGMVLEIEQFKDHRFSQSSNEWQLLVSWVGLQAEEDSWESLEAMVAEVPVKVKEYVGGCNGTALKTTLAELLVQHYPVRST